MLNYAKLCIFVALNGNTCSSGLPDAAVSLPQHLRSTIPRLLSVGHSGAFRALFDARPSAGGHRSSGVRGSELTREAKQNPWCVSASHKFTFRDKICFLPYCRNTNGFCLVV